MHRVPLSSKSKPGKRPSSRRRLAGLIAAVTAVCGFAAVTWYATNEGRKDSAKVVPVLKADTTPVKVRPIRPGGLDVPNQDKLIFERFKPQPPKPKVENLLPAPEKPLEKPQSVRIAEPPTGPLAPEAPALRPRTPAPQSAAKAAKPAPSKPATAQKKGGFVVQLGAIRSASQAIAQAKRLNRSHRDVLKGSKVRVVRTDLGKRGVYHRLRAGPVRNRKAAAALCSALAKRKVGCIVIKP
jgi:cell division septation protein DedD